MKHASQEQRDQEAYKMLAQKMSAYNLQTNVSRIEDNIGRVSGKVTDMVEACDEQLSKLCSLVEQDVMQNAKS